MSGSGVRGVAVTEAGQVFTWQPPNDPPSPSRIVFPLSIPPLSLPSSTALPTSSSSSSTPSASASSQPRFIVRNAVTTDAHIMLSTYPDIFVGDILLLYIILFLLFFHSFYFFYSYYCLLSLRDPKRFRQRLLLRISPSSCSLQPLHTSSYSFHLFCFLLGPPEDANPKSRFRRDVRHSFSCCRSWYVIE